MTGAADIQAMRKGGGVEFLFQKVAMFVFTVTIFAFGLGMVYAIGP